MTPHGEGGPSLTADETPLRSGPSAIHPHEDESKSPTRCPVDDRPVPRGFGRPRTYCSTECRREAYRRRLELDDLEEQLAVARERLASGHAPGAYFWEGTVAMLERQVAELRELLP